MGMNETGRALPRPQVFRDDGSDLVDQMFRARAELFHDRLKWDVTVDERGHERDQYDTPVARYLILADAAGRHVASCRFIPLTEPNMTCDAFPGLFDRSMIEDPDRAVEITRFCVTSGGRDMSARLFGPGSNGWPTPSLHPSSRCSSPPCSGFTKGPVGRQRC